MAWHDQGGDPPAKRLFARTAPVELTTSAGGTAMGRGVISALRQSGREAGPARHPMGALSRPLYHFVGWLPEDPAGGVLRQGGLCCRVLEVRPVTLGGKRLCVRALLEREEEEDGDGTISE